MVQLSLLATAGSRTLEEELVALVRAAPGADECIRAEAARTTAARFRSWRGAALGPSERARVHAYYRAVVRRRVLDGRDAVAQEARQRLVAASIEADLRAAGWNPERAAAEAQRITGYGRNAEAVA